jgi:hypothetical protein
MVTPEVFARYGVGDSFYDRLQRREQNQSEDSKATVGLIHRTRHQRIVHSRHTHRKVATHHQRRRSMAFARCSSGVVARD